MRLPHIAAILALTMVLSACTSTRTLQDAYQAWNPDGDYYDSLSLEELEALAEQEEPDALLELGMRLINGDQVARDEARAIDVFSRLSAMNDPRGHYMLGAAYAQGAGVPKDEARGVELFRQGAEMGYDIAQYWYAFMISRGRGVPEEDWKEALIWFKKSAQQGNPDAEYATGELLISCRGGVSPDIDQATKWFRRAARQGNGVAQANILRLTAAGFIEWQDGDPGAPPTEIQPLEGNDCIGESGNIT